MQVDPRRLSTNNTVAGGVGLRRRGAGEMGVASGYSQGEPC